MTHDPRLERGRARQLERAPARQVNHLSGVRESLPDQRFEFLNLSGLNVALRLPELGDDQLREPPSPFPQVGHRLGHREPVFSLTLDCNPQTHTLLESQTLGAL